MGSGGTFVTIGAVAKGFADQAGSPGSASRLSQAVLRATVDRLLAMSVDEIGRLAAVPAGRAEVLQAGAVCAERAVARIGVPEITVSVSDILDGLALHVVEESIDASD